MELALTASEMRAADREAIERFHLPEILLIEHAALAAFARLKLRFARSLPQTRGYLMIGPGNNGADALALARLLADHGVREITLGIVDSLGENGQRQLAMLDAFEPIVVDPTSDADIRGLDWYVDGLFGTGLKRAVDGPARRAIEVFNAVSKNSWSLALDIPSGLSGDTGAVLGIAVEAKETVTFGFLKRGLLTGAAADHVGKVHLAPAQIPATTAPETVTCFAFEKSDARSGLPIRKPASHKGSHGHVGVFAGGKDKEGASLIAAIGALKSGAGLVTVLGENLEEVRRRSPIELMFAGLDAPLDKFAALVVGPGLDPESADVAIERALAAPCPVICDAEALNRIATAPEHFLPRIQNRSAPTVLTPHPKEAARLLGGEVAYVEADRFEAIRRLVERFEVWFALKGRGTLVSGPERPIFVVDRGDASLAKGGSGDLLAGILGTFVAGGVDAHLAIAAACYVHGRSAELTTQRFGQTRSALVTEIAAMLPDALAELEDGR